MPYTVIMPVIAKEILHGSSHTFGFLMGASGLGALIGTLYLASRKNVPGLGRIVPLAAALFGFGLITFSFSSYVWLSLVLMVIIGLGMMLQIFILAPKLSQSIWLVVLHVTNDRHPESSLIWPPDKFFGFPSSHHHSHSQNLIPEQK